MFKLSLRGALTDSYLDMATYLIGIIIGICKDPIANSQWPSMKQMKRRKELCLKVKTMKLMEADKFLSNSTGSTVCFWSSV